MKRNIPLLFALVLCSFSLCSCGKSESVDTKPQISVSEQETETTIPEVSKEKEPTPEELEAQRQQKLENDFVDMVNGYVPSMEAHEEWIGNYLSEELAYNDPEGMYATVEVSANKAIALRLYGPKETYRILFEETGITTGGTVDYYFADTPESASDKAELVFERTSYRTSLHFSSESPNLPEKVELYLYEPGIFREAPPEYEDEDMYGTLTSFLDSHPDFVPEEENYIYYCNENYIYCDSDGDEEKRFTCITLNEIDENGYITKQREAAIYDSAKVAQEQAEPYPAAIYGTYVDGNTVYTQMSPECLTLDEYLSMQYCNFYEGKNYAYIAGEDVVGNCIFYFSSPYSKSELPFEYAVERGRMKSGIFKSTDTESATVSISYAYDPNSRTNYDDFYFNGVDFKSSGGGVRKYYDATHFTDIRYFSNAFLNITAVFVREYAIEDDTLVVSEYEYRVDDLTQNEITCDNHKSYTAESVITHSFDLTKTVE